MTSGLAVTPGRLVDDGTDLWSLPCFTSPDSLFPVNYEATGPIDASARFGNMFLNRSRTMPT